jgi:hypothetical protein
VSDTITLEIIQRDQAREESITRIVSVAGIVCGVALLNAPSFISLEAMRVAYRGHPVVAEFIWYVNIVLDFSALLVSPSALCGSLLLLLLLLSHYENCGRYQRSKKLALEVINETNKKYASEPNAKNHEALAITQSIAMRCLKEMGGGREVETYWKKLSEMPDFSSESKASSLVYVYTNLGFSALAFDDFDKAVTWLNKGRDCYFNKLGKLHEAEEVEIEARQIRAFHCPLQIEDGIAGGVGPR